MRLIDADKLILKFQGDLYGVEIWNAIQIINIINDIGSIEGKWLRDRLGHQECSVCHADCPTDGHIYIHTKFCPNCGTKMC